MRLYIRKYSYKNVTSFCSPGYWGIGFFLHFIVVVFFFHFMTLSQITNFRKLKIIIIKNKLS